MKQITCLLTVLLIKSALLFSQGVYFKTSADMNISTGTQPMPDYISIRIPIPPGQLSNYDFKDFSIASGLNLQAVAGYSFNDFLSLELRFSTFSNFNREFETPIGLLYSGNVKTEWDLRYYELLPTIMFGKSFNKSAVNIFVCSGAGISKLNIKATANEIFNEYEFDRSMSFSWGYGLEYLYSVSAKLSLFTNIGINNTCYNPEKAHLISSSYPIEYLTTRQKEIKYVNDITNLETTYDKPEYRLKETLKMNSIYLGIGIKYTLK